MKNILQFKKRDEPIVMLTCYDHPSACVVRETDIDAVLVGDSVSMVVHGHAHTTQATLDMMVLHTKAVARGLGDDTLLIADLPFMSYRKGLVEAMHATEALVRAGAHAVKLEGAQGNLELIQHMVESGVPVMGHLGLTPQHCMALGGFRVQGRDKEAAEVLHTQSMQLQEAGCFALVLECIPEVLAKSVTETLSIPTIGIGAGRFVDGQILVWHDVLGLGDEFKPRFLKQYAKTQDVFKQALLQYVQEVKQGVFPAKEHAYVMKEKAE